MSRSTHALVVTRNGGPEVLEVQQHDVVDPGPGEVLVEVVALGVNFVDVYRRKGVYPIPTPFVNGAEGSGTVLATGPDCRVSVGDRVAWAEVPGSGAGLVVAPDDALVPVPEVVDLETAAAIMLQGMTAHFLVTTTYAAQAGETALVHASTGGVGQLLVQWLKAKGATVIGTAGSPDKQRLASSLGVDVVLGYDDFAGAAREATGGRGVDVVYDGVGAATFDGSLGSLCRRGTMVLYGGASGQVPPFDPQRLNSGGSLFLTRPKLADHTADREELLWRAREVFDAVAGGILEPAVGGRYELAEAARAYADLEGRRTTGKLLLIP